MKKVFSLALALVLAFCMAMPAFAAESEGDKPAAKPAATPAPSDSEEPKETMDNGLVIEGNTNPTSAAGEALLGSGKLGQVLQSAGITVAANQTCSVAMMMDLDGEPGTYTFNVPTAGPTDKVVVLHWNSVFWEKVGEGIGSRVDAYFSSLSPVAIVVIKDNGTTAAAVSASAGTGALRAPQTGDSMAIPFVAFAVIALAGVVAVKARKEEL